MNAAIRPRRRGGSGAVAEDDLWLRSSVLGEIRKGVELAHRRDTRRAEALEVWLADVMSRVGDRVLPVDTPIAGQ